MDGESFPTPSAGGLNKDIQRRRRVRAKKTIEPVVLSTLTGDKEGTEGVSSLSKDRTTADPGNPDATNGKTPEEILSGIQQVSRQAPIDQELADRTAEMLRQADESATENEIQIHSFWGEPMGGRMYHVIDYSLDGVRQDPVRVAVEDIQELQARASEFGENVSDSEAREFVMRRQLGLQERETPDDASDDVGNRALDAAAAAAEAERQRLIQEARMRGMSKEIPRQPEVRRAGFFGWVWDLLLGPKKEEGKPAPAVARDERDSRTLLQQWEHDHNNAYPNASERYRAAAAAVRKRGAEMLSEGERLGYAKSLYTISEKWKKDFPPWKRVMISGLIVGSGIGIAAVVPPLAGFAAASTFVWRGFVALNTGAAMGAATQKYLEKRNYNHAAKWGWAVTALTATGVFAGGQLLGDYLQSIASGGEVPAPSDMPSLEETLSQQTPGGSTEVEGKPGGSTGVMESKPGGPSAPQVSEQPSAPTVEERPERPRARSGIPEYRELTGSEPRFGTREWWDWRNRMSGA